MSPFLCLARARPFEKGHFKGTQEGRDFKGSVAFKQPELTVIWSIICYRFSLAITTPLLKGVSSLRFGTLITLLTIIMMIMLLLIKTISPLTCDTCLQAKTHVKLLIDSDN